ncbi:MAG: hypothetical protein IKT27_03315 [Clostridia bacterium]|nr:hypothetical protein [Clostridia bacterium]
MLNLYYRKLSSSTPKVYLTATDGCSNSDALISSMSLCQQTCIANL